MRLLARIMVLVAAGSCLAPVAPAWADAEPVPTSVSPRSPAHCDLNHFNRGWPRLVCIREQSYDADVCRAIALYARGEGLPEGYFARLVWQESRFDLNALSPAGAEGIAQFMPTTGRLRGLGNAFNPAEALARSAEYLKFLAGKFGNLGLAAAAYNAGEGRMEGVAAGTGYVPGETEAYVRIVTGYPVDQWLAAPPETVDWRLSETEPFEAACVTLAATRRVPQFQGPPQAPWKPWGVQVAADFSEAKAQRIYDAIARRFSSVIGSEAPMLVRERNPNFGPKPRYHARIGRDTRAEAEALCRRLVAAGGACMVMKN